MDSGSPIGRLPSFERGDRLDGRKLSHATKAINRANTGVYPPRQIFSNVSSSQVQTTASILVDAVADSNVSISGLQTIDSIALTSGMLVLLTAQTDPTQNGVYKVNSLVTGWKKNTPLQVPAVAAKTGTVYGLTWWLLQSTNVYKQVQSGSSATIVSRVATTLVTTTGPQTIDGGSATNGSLVLLTAQGGSSNGVYKVNTGVGVAWTKATPFQPTVVIATAGTLYTNTQWYLNSANTFKAVVGVYG